MHALGRAMQGTAAIVQQKVAEDDVTNVRVSMAKARAEWDVKFRDDAAKSTPGDPNFAGKFTQDFKDFLAQGEQVPQTREGQHTYKLLSAELTGHFAEKAGIFAVQSAGLKAKLDWDVSQRAYATSVITDPTSYSSVLNQAIAEIRDPNGQYGRIDGNTRTALETKARDTLAQAYINGLVDNGAPELARKLLMDGRLDDQLEPKDKQRLVHSADAGITAKRVASEHADALARKAEKDRVQQVNDGLMDKFMAGKLTWGDVKAAGLPAFGEGSQDTWMRHMKQQAKDWAEKPAKTSPTVFNDVRERIDLPAGDPRRITDSSEVWKFYGNGLSEPHAAALERRVRDNRSESGQKWSQAEAEFIRNVRPQLDKSTMNSIDQGGGERVQSFTSYLRDAANAANKAGKDPYKLLDPRSPDYVGKDIPRFQTPAQRTAAGISDKLNAAMARRPNETPAQYLERTK